MRSLFAKAIVLSADHEQDPGLRDACAALLATALDAGLDVPAEAPLVLWHWLVGPGAGRSWLLASSLGNIRNENITKEAIDILLAQDSSRERRDAAVDVLSGPMHAVHVGDDRLVDIAARHPEDAERVAKLIKARHDSLTVLRGTLVGIRDYWSSSDRPCTRIGAVEIAVLVDFFDAAWWRAMSHDAAMSVRIATAEALAKVEQADKALMVVRERLLVEPHHAAKAVQLVALGRLVARMSRS